MIQAGRLVTIYVGEIPLRLRSSTPVFFDPEYFDPMELVP
ncbi:MAG: hypothetical protein V7605_2762 [Acidimicrobiaceae bacterium]|jgi:hypothetical protein